MLSYSRYALFFTGLLIGIVPGPAQTADEASVVELKPFPVTAARIAASEVEGPQAIAAYFPDFIESTGAFNVEEFINSLPSDNGATTLILIDGRPTYLDPNSLPLGMIAGIEVSRDGSMPQYGEFHNGRIINIRLKPNHTTHELGTKIEGAWAGGGFRRNLRASGASTRSKLRALYSIEIADNQPLLASQRDFSSEQDRRAEGLRDLRLPWGAPPVVVATEGYLPGVQDAAGNPVRTALVPAGPHGGDLRPGDFLLADPEIGDLPSGQRRFNTAPYRWLVSPSERLSLNLGFTYTFSDRLRLSLDGSHRNTRGQRLGPPPVTAASSHSVVPAAYNPFGHDVAIGMVHESFGPTRQDSETQRNQIGLKLDGKLPGSWKWEASTGYRHEGTHRSGEELDPAKLRAALADPDPARRFNPFSDTSSFDPNAALYPSLSSTRTNDSTSENLEAEVSVRGAPFMLPGGPAQLRLEAEWEDSRRERNSTRTLGAAPERNHFAETSHAWSSALQLPFLGGERVLPLIRRLEIQLAAESESSNDGNRDFEWETGLVWAPVRSLLLRAQFGQTTDTPPARQLAGSEFLIDDILVDPLRGGEAVTGVRLFKREQIAARDEERTRYSLGMVYELPAVRGLALHVTYRARTETGLFEDSFKPQDIVNNASAFADRIQRSTPSPADSANGQPGRIVAVDLTPGSTGEAERTEVEFEVSYRPPATDSGQWRFTAEVDRTLNASYEILPGIPYVSDGGGRYHRPRWRADARATWSRGVWNASAHLQHHAALPAFEGAPNGVGSLTTAALNVGRRWQLPASGVHRRNVKLVAGVNNLFDRDPPRADTIDGYRGGSPLGRTYSGAVTLEF